MEDDEHAQPLLEDDQPSWVTLAEEGDNDTGAESSPLTGSSPWDEAAARPNSRRQQKDDDLPQIVLLMRLGNIGAAALLIVGSVRPIF